MDLHHLVQPLVLLLLVPGLVTACLAVYAWRRRPLPTAGGWRRWGRRCRVRATSDGVRSRA
jgi:hypothetical protein